MKHITLFFILVFSLFAGVIKTPILSVDEANNLVTIKVDRINLGVSGFVVHRLSQNTSSILKSLEVVHYDKQSKIATLKMLAFDSLVQNSLPQGNWNVEVGDIAVLAYAYNRAMLIAPNEEIYYRITKATSQVQWLHPDIFTTILSLNGHPTPLKEDFSQMGDATAVGLVFVYLYQKLLTVDIKSMKIINISNAALNQTSVQLPFYSRITSIDAAWWGKWWDKGSGEVTAYEPYYCQLLVQNNPQNQEIQNICSLRASDIPQDSSFSFPNLFKGNNSWSLKSIYNNFF